MGQVSIELNGRVYRFVCGDGEEAHIAALGDHIRQKVDALNRQHTGAGQDRLLVMAALMIADDLHEARRAADGLPVKSRKPSTG
jgi:cell division protein ZapA